MHRREFAFAAGALLTASAFPATAAAQADPIGAAARALHRRAIVLDCNLAPPIFMPQLPAPQATLDVVRESGMTAIKTTMGGFNASFEDTMAEIAFYRSLVEKQPEHFRQISVASDFAGAKREGQLGIIFSFESAACLEGRIDRIDHFRDLGVRVMQLSYNTPSPFGAGVMSPPEATLTELGREAVARMNALGVALDLSHANPATTAAAMEASTKPVLITHAGCAAVHPHVRNKTDDQLRAVAAKGGVIGIYDLFYLTPAPRPPNLDDYIAHMTHALDVCGEDHVGIGSDTSFAAMPKTERAAWAGAMEQRRAAGAAAPEEDGRLPLTEGLDRADRALVIADALLRRGYSSRAAEKVLGANFVRAFGDIWS
jgi:membrane dipeptidase